MERMPREHGEDARRAASAAAPVPLSYCPLVDLDARRIVGFAAHPPDGLLDMQFLREACAEAAHWPADFVLAMKVAPEQLRKTAFSLKVMQALAESEFPAARLELEIAEDGFCSEDAPTRLSVEMLHAAGVRLALGQFGTGYVSRSELGSLPIGKISIDASLVAALGAAAGDSTPTVSALADLAAALGLILAAAGIETEDHLAALRAEGCMQGEGRLFGAAMPASEVRAMLRHPPLAVAAA